MFGALTLVALVCASISHVATADHVVYAPPPPTPTLSSTRTFVNLDALPLGLRPSPCLGGVDELHARLRSVERAQAQAADVVSAQARFLGGSDRGFLGGAFEGWGRPHWFLSQVYADAGRHEEARDAAIARQASAEAGVGTRGAKKSGQNGGAAAVSGPSVTSVYPDGSYAVIIGINDCPPANIFTFSWVDSSFKAACKLSGFTYSNVAGFIRLDTSD